MTISIFRLFLVLFVSFLVQSISLSFLIRVYLCSSVANGFLQSTVSSVDSTPSASPARARREMTKQLHEVPIFSGMKEVIEELNSAKIDLYIVSSNGNKNIYKFMKINHMENSFKKVYGGIGLRGKAKALQAVVRKNGLDPSTTFYVGDETRDVNAAKTAGLRTVSVTWGYNGKKILLEQKPEKIVDKPSQLTKILIG